MRNLGIRFLPAVLMALFAAGCASTQPESKSESAATEAKPATSSQAAMPAPMMMSYNVVRGDHLWGISSKPTIYGNPYEWPLIFKANRDKIQDADLIEPGQVLSIEKNPAGTEVAAAIEHAKTRGAWKLGVTEKSDLAYLAR